MHLKKARKIINLGACIAAAGIMAVGTPVLAEDAGAPAETQTEAPAEPQPETPQPETPAPQPETPAPETQPAQPEPQPETPQPETQAPQPETPAPETQPETPAGEVQSEPQTTGGTEEAAPETEEATQKKEKEEEKQSETESEAEGDEGQEYYSPYSSNEELLAHQNIVSVSKFYRPMFTHVEADTAILKAGSIIHEEKSGDSKQVGIAKEMCLTALIADKDDDWVYIEAGKVRGFANKEDLVCGKTAELIMRRTAIDPQKTAEELVPYYENEAFLYSMDTTRKVEAEKVCALAKKEISVYDEKSGSATEVGSLPKNAVAYILADEGNWAFVESGTVRGFVKKKNLITGHMAEAAENVLNGAIPVAEEKVKPGDNKAYYYTLTYVEEPDPNMRLRASIVDFALQFVGNPYVWGGTSLTNGADCSGFVQSVYANFGYSLPRVACDQAGYGKQITIDSAQPGDLIFYARNGYVYHVSMYIGDGRVVQAYSSSAGIITSEIGGNAVWATSIL